LESITKLKKRIDESIQYYEKALEINPLFPNIWFTLGCIYLQLKTWEKAVRCFSKCVQLDDSSGESWANLASAFTQLKKDKEALKCLEEGFKRSRTNWRICENLILLSIECHDLSRLFTGVLNLISLEKFDKLQPKIFYQMVKLFFEKYFNLPENLREIYKKTEYITFLKHSL